LVFVEAADATPMTRDKQLRGIDIREVRCKRDADQALNIKEFAVLAGISYSVARDWFNSTGFPRVHGMIFWQDFVLWRRAQNAKRNVLAPPPVETGVGFSMGIAKPHPQWPHRATKILSEANALKTGGA
jgi:hypothetical protein